MVSHETRVWVDADAGSAMFSIRDNGQGIHHDFLPHIVDRFSQQQSSDSRIGLSIVKSLVELHGGDVKVTSEGTGHGSELIVRLPLTSAFAAK